MNQIVEVTPEQVMVRFANGQYQYFPLHSVAYPNPLVNDVVEVRTDAQGRVLIQRAAAVQNPNVTVNVTQQNPVMPGKAVNKVAYCLFAIFLGGLGIHKFYSGKVGMGVVYILFCWTFIPAVIGLIEGIIGLTKTADANGNIYIS